MGRLLAIMAAEALSFATCLRAVSRSSPSLSEADFETWSAAVYSGESKWDLWTGRDPNGENGLSASLAHAPIGTALLAHVRTRRSVVQTPLCRRGRWVFAYDGTVEDAAYLRAQTSAVRRASHDGSDGQRLLAFLLTHLDAKGLADSEATDAVDDAVAVAASELSYRIGSLSFVLSDGDALYAYRFDRALHFLERAASVKRAATILVASEPFSTEPWTTLDDRTLLRCRQAKTLDVKFILGRDPRVARISDVELPFTD